MTKLEELPARIDDLQVQILQFREETRSEFSAVRREIHELRRETSDQFDQTNAEIQQSRREMRVLHEDVISRIALLGEVGPARRRAAVPREPRKKR